MDIVVEKIAQPYSLFMVYIYVYFINVCIYIHIYIYICIYMYICLYIHIYMYINTQIYIGGRGGEGEPTGNH
jgi:hypothetical protein